MNRFWKIWHPIVNPFSIFWSFVVKQIPSLSDSFNIMFDWLLSKGSVGPLIQLWDFCLKIQSSRGQRLHVDESGEWTACPSAKMRGFRMRGTGPLDFNYSHASALQNVPHWCSRLHFLEPWGKARRDLSQIPRYQFSEGRLRVADKDEVSRKKSRSDLLKLKPKRGSACL